MVNADSMNVCIELLATTLDRSTLHGKCLEAAKRKALGMGISPRALGEAATAWTDRGTWRARTGTSWNGNNERRRAAAVPSGGKVDAELAEVVAAEAFLCWHSRAREFMVRWGKQRG